MDTVGQLATAWPWDPDVSLILLGPLGPKQQPAQTALWAIVCASSGVCLFLLFKFRSKEPACSGRVPTSHLGTLASNLYFYPDLLFRTQTRRFGITAHA